MQHCFLTIKVVKLWHTEVWKQAVDATIAWAEYIRHNNEWAGYLKSLCLNNWNLKCQMWLSYNRRSISRSNLVKMISDIKMTWKHRRSGIMTADVVVPVQPDLFGHKSWIFPKLMGSLESPMLQRWWMRAHFRTINSCSYCISPPLFCEQRLLWLLIWGSDGGMFASTYIFFQDLFQWLNSRSYKVMGEQHCSPTSLVPCSGFSCYVRTVLWDPQQGLRKPLACMCSW